MAPHSNRSKHQAIPGREPRPEELKAAREAAALTQEEAAALIYTSPRNWQNWEQGHGDRRMPASAFELFMLKTGQFTFERLVVFDKNEPATSEGVSLLELRLSNRAVIVLRMPGPSLGSLSSGIGSLVS